MGSLIKIISRLLPLKLKVFLSYLKGYNHSPYKINYLINPPLNISDFFIFDTDCEKIIFIAENIRALILGHEVTVTHKFLFFSRDGKLLEIQSFKAKAFYEKIILKPIPSKDKYLSFIHYAESDLNLQSISKGEGRLNHISISEQNRGYSIYYPNNYSIGSVVHGNFGGITKDLIKTARVTLLSHIYTPIYKFDKNSKYDLVFNNPTDNKILIKIKFNSSSKIVRLYIESMGTSFQRISDYEGSLSFESKLPICRALVFKNPTPDNFGNFDVFHS